MTGIPIRFGTDGWRGIVGREFTVEQVARITEGVIHWMKEQKEGTPLVVLGNDTRFGSDLFVETVLRACQKAGIPCEFSREPFIPTPALSYRVKERRARAGIMLTASHNPYFYHGYKLKNCEGAPAPVSMLREIESRIPEHPSLSWTEVSGHLDRTRGISLLKGYIEAIRNHFHLSRLLRHFTLAVDVMYGAAQELIHSLMGRYVKMLRRTRDAFFGGGAPEPIPRHLTTTIQWMRAHPEYDACIVLDGDADRLGLILRGGKYLSTHQIILLLVAGGTAIHNWKGRKVILTVSVSERVRRFCEERGLVVEQVPVGFKHIAPRMIEDPQVVLGAEESGGFALRDHLPERDGLWSALTILTSAEQMGISLTEMMRRIEQETGPMAYIREDILLISRNGVLSRETIIRRLEALSSIGSWSIQHVITLDGWKAVLDDDRWILVRPSGTEPLLRIYAEGRTEEEARQMIRAIRKALALD